MEVSRREAIAALIGVPAALAACRRAEPLPEGSLVFPSEAMGHRLRGAPPPVLPDDRLAPAGVVIVGGGVAGLAAAWRLRCAGVDDFVLLELDPVAGGTAKSGANAVSAYPWGAHYITAPMRENRALVALLEEMGALEGQDDYGEPIVRENLLCREPAERLFANGRWTEGLYLRRGASGEDLAELAAFHAEVDRWAAARDGRGRRAFAIPLASSSDDPDVTDLDRMSASEWMDRKGWGSTRLRWYVDYACRDDYGSRLEHTSAYAALFYFASRTRAPGAEAQPVVTWPEGNARLVAHLFDSAFRSASDSARAQARLGWMATDVAPRADATGEWVAVTAMDASGALAGYRAERVVFAAPRFVAKHVLRPWRDAPPAFLADFDASPWMVANLTLRDRPKSRGLPFAWDNVLYDSPSLGYVVATHQRGEDHGPTVLTYYFPLCDDDTRAARTRLLDAGWAEWARVALHDLSAAHPELPSLVTRLDIVRWGHGMVKPRPGFLWGAARRAAAAPFRRVHFAHTDLSGMALFEEAFDHGVRAAEEVLAARGLRFEAMR